MNQDILTIIDNFGINNQLRKIAEEHQELQDAVYENIYCEKYAPNAAIPGEWENHLRYHIAEEIADNMLLLKQIQYYHGITDDEINDMMCLKIKRTLDRIRTDYYAKNK